MSSRQIIITNNDQQRLEHLLASEITQAIESKSRLAELKAELQCAMIVESADVPSDVITMDSTVRLRDLDTNEVETYTLVYPNRANIAEDRLSILAPIGTAILGYRVGNVVRWHVPDGKRYLLVEEILYQPEREGVLQAEH